MVTRRGWVGDANAITWSLRILVLKPCFEVAFAVIGPVHASATLSINVFVTFCVANECTLAIKTIAGDVVDNGARGV